MSNNLCLKFLLLEFNLDQVIIRECSTLFPNTERSFANKYPSQLPTRLLLPVLHDQASENPVTYQRHEDFISIRVLRFFFTLSVARIKQINLSIRQMSL